MFFLLELLFSLVIALLLTGIFAMVVRGVQWGWGLFLFFLIVWLGSWAAGAWVTPIGPALWGVSWLGFLVFGILFALLLTALTPHDWIPPTVRTEEEVESAAVVDTFIWLLLIALVFVVASAYLF